jgi:hypothetical protein
VVVVVVVVVVLVDVGGGEVVVVVNPHGQSSVIGTPTATARQVSASVAVAGIEPFGAQTQVACGSQTSKPTATLRIRRQSVAAGRLPSVSGCEQSPLAAMPSPGAIANNATSRADNT